MAKTVALISQCFMALLLYSFHFRVLFLKEVSYLIMTFIYYDE